MARRQELRGRGRTPAAGQADSVRNVVLVGHSGAGKTTLVEALLVRTGAIQRAGRVEDGTTVSDFDEVEVRQQRSVNLTLAPVMHAERQGQPAGHARVRRLHRRPAGWPARRGRCAVHRVRRRRRRRPDPHAVGRVRARGTPRAVVITKIDHQRAEFDDALAACRDAFGDSVAPLYLPVATARARSAG